MTVRTVVATLRVTVVRTVATLRVTVQDFICSVVFSPSFATAGAASEFRLLSHRRRSDTFETSCTKWAPEVCDFLVFVVSFFALEFRLMPSGEIAFRSPYR